MEIAYYVFEEANTPGTVAAINTPDNSLSAVGYGCWRGAASRQRCLPLGNLVLCLLHFLSYLPARPPFLLWSERLVTDPEGLILSQNI